MLQRVKVETNEDAVGTVKRLAREGIKILRGMGLEPVDKIRTFADELVRQINLVDLTVKPKLVEQIDVERRQFLSPH